MASPSRIVLDKDMKPVFYKNLWENSAIKASRLLQENHEKHHIFFNKGGFHNHIVHHLLTIYALGASPDEIQSAYDNNVSYQRPQVENAHKGTTELDDPKIWRQCLGKERYYHDFLVFFQNEMEQSSCDEVINKYLFAGDERADDLLVRLHAGFLHPLIHLGFGVEFQQPAIVAEALAQAAVHSGWIGDKLLPAERAANDSGRKFMERSIASLLDESRANPTLRTAAHWKDGNKIRNGVMARAPDEAIGILSQVVIGEDEIDERMAEMMNTAVYFTACAQRPDKIPKIDFYYMHCVNASIFYPVLLGPTSPLSKASKKRLLEYKIRMDIGMYISRRAPDLYINEVRDVQGSSRGNWDTLIEKMCSYPDDGHASKFLRTVAATEQFCQPFEQDEDRFRIRANDYLNVGQLVMGSVEGKDDKSGEARWARSVGFDEAWEQVPSRPVSVS